MTKVQTVLFHSIPMMTAAAFLFTAGLNKRRHAPGRMGAAFLLTLVLAELLNRLLGVPSTILWETLYYPAFLGIGVCLVMGCCGANSSEALFCVLCGMTLHLFTISAQRLPKILLLRANVSADAVFNTPLLDLGIFLFCYGAAWFLMVRPMHRMVWPAVQKKSAFLPSFGMLPVMILLSAAAIMLSSRHEDSLLFLVFQLYTMFCCVDIFWIQIDQFRLLQTQREADRKEQLLIQQKQQFAISKNNIELINRKCHDLRHQVDALRHLPEGERRESAIREMEQAVMIYDSAVRTGNETVDVVLTEKSLYCQAHNITLACVADGKRLAFMDIVDLYTIFGNALDNAIEAVSQLQDHDKRYISLKIFQDAGFLMIQIENFYAVEPQFQDGLPVTTKQPAAEHGFGMKSILYCAEKYDGCVTAHTQNQVFYLQILIPLRGDAE